MKFKTLFYLSIFVIASAITSCKPAKIAGDAIVLNVDLSGISEKVPDRNKVDFHPDYGIIKPYEFPMKKEGWSSENILSDAGIQKEEMEVLFVAKKLYTGKLLSEHLMEDGKVVPVWHEYKDEPVVITAAETNDGKITVNVVLMNCGNSGSGTSSPFNLIPYEGELKDFIRDCLISGVKVVYS